MPWPLLYINTSRGLRLRRVILFLSRIDGDRQPRLAGDPVDLDHHLHVARRGVVGQKHIDLIEAREFWGLPDIAQPMVGNRLTFYPDLRGHDDLSRKIRQLAVDDERSRLPQTRGPQDH